MSRRRTLAAVALCLSICQLAAAQSSPPKAPPPAAAFPESAPATSAAPAASAEVPTEPAPAPASPATPADAASAPTPAPSSVPPPPPPPPGYAQYPYPYPPYPYPYPYPDPHEYPPSSEPDSQKPKPSRIFLQLAMGPGLYRAHNSASVDERHFSGGSFSGHFVIGGRVSPVAAIGGGYVHDQIFSLSSRDDVIDGDEPDLSNTNLTIDSLCVFLDFSVPSARGLHFPIYLGFSELTEHTGSKSRASDATVLFLGAGAGYDFDIGRHFYLGGLLRASISEHTVRENNGTDIRSFIPALMLAVTYDPSK